MNATSRHEVTILQYAHPYPKFSDNGLRKTYEQVFINSGGEVTPELAQKHLLDIQEQHDKKNGWVCDIGHEGVFKDTDGLWYAYRHHAQYK